MGSSGQKKPRQWLRKIRIQRCLRNRFSHVLCDLHARQKDVLHKPPSLFVIRDADAILRQHFLAGQRSKCLAGSGSCAGFNMTDIGHPPDFSSYLLFSGGDATCYCCAQMRYLKDTRATMALSDTPSNWTIQCIFFAPRACTTPAIVSSRLHELGHSSFCAASSLLCHAWRSPCSPRLCGTLRPAFCWGVPDCGLQRCRRPFLQPAAHLCNCKWNEIVNFYNLCQFCDG